MKTKIDDKPHTVYAPLWLINTIEQQSQLERTERRKAIAREIAIGRAAEEARRLSR